MASPELRISKAEAEAITLQVAWSLATLRPRASGEMLCALDILMPSDCALLDDQDYRDAVRLSTTALASSKPLRSGARRWK